MTVAEVWAIFKTIGALIGIIITFITFIGLISKRPIKSLKKMIREESKSANEDLENNIKTVETHVKELEIKAQARFDQIDEQFQAVEKTNDDMIRNTLTHIYFKYKDQKKIPHYEKENVLHLFARYNGNSYVHTIVDEMKNWEEII